MLRCSTCEGEVLNGDRYCPNCGAPLTSTHLHRRSTTLRPPVVSRGRRPERTRARMAVALILVSLLAVASFVLVVDPSSYLASSVGSASGCPSAGSVSTNSSGSSPDYDVQQIEVFAQSYHDLAFNVTAIAQCDASGFGPSYLLNGLTNTGYWFQVGIDWNWPLQTGGFSPGFGFVSEGWAPGGETSASPFVPLSGTVNNGDTIQMTLSLSGGQVIAGVRDVDTGASASTSYAAGAATAFVGSQDQQSQPRFSFATEGYFTGLMTEWYHASPNMGGEGKDVTYSSSSTAVPSATVGVGEWNFTGRSPSTIFAYAANYGEPLSLTSEPQSFAVAGFSVSASTTEFVTTG